MPLEQTSHLAGSVLMLPCFPVQPFPTIAHAAGFGRLKVTSHPVKSNYGLCLCTLLWDPSIGHYHAHIS